MKVTKQKRLLSGLYVLGLTRSIEIRLLVDMRSKSWRIKIRIKVLGLADALCIYGP